ncbi:MAG TPA: cysteine desulfurase family protein [Acidimicrobiales bacterium]|nr:cysteine desulfurase family protein [Acidimicrobiales bacterium]
MPVYLDHAAGGPLHPDARAAMLPWLTDRFGNPSGSHQVARAAREAIDSARDTLAEMVGIEPGGVVFTSGGTESDNLAVLGTVAARPGCVVVSAVEHPAVAEAAAASGREVRVAPVNTDGVVEPARLRPLLGDDVALVSVQTVNHETGVVQPIPDILRLVRRRAPGARFHTDAVQAAAWLDVAEVTAGADLVSLSSHKLGGPQGAGALAIRPEIAIHPVLHGGGQEREMRSGTQNVAAIVGFAAAVRATAEGREATSARVSELRDSLAKRITYAVPSCVVTSAASRRVAGHLHVRFPGVESEALLVLLDEAGVCASAGAACASGAIEPSPVLLAMGVDKDEAVCSLRLSLGPTTSVEDVEFAAAAVVDAVSKLGGR